MTMFKRHSFDAARPAGAASPSTPTAIERLRVRVRGVVQGVGFRPFVWNLAQRHRLSGWVRNESRQVTIEVQGPTADLELFLKELQRAAPPAARIDAIDFEPLLTETEAGFRMMASDGTERPLPSLPADLAICEECRREILDPQERRYRYPFTNCTQCGPRWSIVCGVPYDRPQTSMHAFTMCAECRAEYENPADRRYHAQPIACPRCGPRLFFDPPEPAHTAADGPTNRSRASAAAEVIPGDNDSANVPVRLGELLRAGKIVALMGLGGFQLLVDAGDESAVAELRRRKHRPDKPFAVLVRSLDEAKRLCFVTTEEAQLLTSPAAPIVLLRRRDDAVGLSIAAAVAPDNPYLGVMLPCTPLHELVARAAGRPLVCTSGNLAEEPMAITVEEGRDRLRAITDVLVVHNRPIVRPVDDSVARLGPPGPMILRRARGYAPLPIPLPLPEGIEPRPWLAVGGHLKNAVGVLVGLHAVLSSHIGDLDNAAAVDVFERAVDDLLNFYRVEPAGVVCDRHPDYASTRFAEQWARRRGAALLRVQHHHAHAAACMAEHAIVGPLLAFCWDGTGYGDDGTAWGGEALLCQGTDYRRFAHLRPFPLPGGDRAAREPFRSAIGLLTAARRADDEQGQRHIRRWLSAEKWKTMRRAIERGMSAPLTSGIGRLFDALAALCGLHPRTSFEGQAAMAFEFVADPSETAGYPLPLRQADGSPNRASADGSAASNAESHAEPPLWLDWQPLVEQLLADLAAETPTSVIAARFHNSLVEAAVTTAEAARAIVPELTVALTGGCFQNARLTQRLYLRLLERGFRCFLPQQFPPGDGGVALGQLYLAALSDAAG